MRFCRQRSASAKKIARPLVAAKQEEKMLARLLGADIVVRDDGVGMEPALNPGAGDSGAALQTRLLILCSPSPK